MPLLVGERLGPYEILAPIGAGGMGEVYRARDTKLDRDVAIKVLPAALAQHPDRLARFEREAKVLAALNHPNIAAIYGLEDRAIVMELVEGPTLADRIAAGALPPDESLNIAAQIADALEAAHEKGVVHRDLKPANVKVREDGTVKVLDFGLATALQSSTREAGSGANSPTLTMGATEVGVILGTASYMSPEQAAGKPVDRRADIWSFGVVLWEMLTGRRLFDGESISHTLADVLRAEIDFGTLPASTPVPIRELLKRCLDRDIKTRLRDIGEARIAIQRWLANPFAGAKTPPLLSRLGRAVWPAAAVFAMLATAVSLWALWRQPPLETQSQRFSIEAPSGTHFDTAPTSPAAISPDGHLLVFVAARSGLSGPLWLRPMDSLDARELPGTQGSSDPFWSPDGKSIGFFAEGKLKRVEVLGGPPQVLCDAASLYGATWSKDGVILFSAASVIQRVAATGGVPSPVTAIDASRQEVSHYFPWFLPDGRSFLYDITSRDPNSQGIYVGTLDQPKKRSRIVGARARAAYAPPYGGHPGYLLWLREQTLMAQPFDAGKLRLEGDPVPIAEGLLLSGAGRALFWTSENGMLLYRTGAGPRQNTQLTWLDREGKVADTVGKEGPRYSLGLKLSPDGTRAAGVERGSEGNFDGDIWLYEFARDSRTKLTADSARHANPVWSADGTRLAYVSDRNLYLKDSSGAGNAEELLKSSETIYLYDWSHDGRFLLYGAAQGRKDGLWLLSLSDHKSTLYLKPDSLQHQARFSPDGNFVAYASDESGKNEVYVRPFPMASAGKWTISSGGGTQPLWRRDGKELFYLSADSKIMAVPMPTSPALKPGLPKALFPVTINGGSGIIRTHDYDVTGDGRKFLINSVLREGPDASSSIAVVLNWQATLKK